MLLKFFDDIILVQIIGFDEMAKYIGIITGSAVTLIGLIALIKWWDNFLVLLKGTIPLFLIFGGIIAIIAGVSEIKDIISARR